MRLTGLRLHIASFVTSFAVIGFAPSAFAEQNIVLAEYRADVDPLLNNLELNIDQPIHGDGGTSPWGQYRRGLRGSARRISKFGDVYVGGVFDVSLSKIGTLTDQYGIERSMSVGPQISFGPSSKTYLFYGLNQADVQTVQRPEWGGDSYSQRTGVTHAWSGNNNDTEFTVGYEYEYGSTEDLFDDKRAHSISLSGRFPLAWGVYAQVEADYSRFSYLDYQNEGSTDSKRQLFRAAVERSFNEKLYGGLQFSYLNEDFVDQEFSYQRRTWGFNLKYQY